MAVDIEVIWGSWKRKSFCREDWTGQIRLIAKENFFFGRNAIVGDGRAFSSLRGATRRSNPAFFAGSPKQDCLASLAMTV
jgi:hypothetical protein